jgi:hypothetical protein
MRRYHRSDGNVKRASDLGTAGIQRRWSGTPKHAKKRAPLVLEANDPVKSARWQRLSVEIFVSSNLMEWNHNISK